MMSHREDEYKGEKYYKLFVKPTKKPKKERSDTSSHFTRKK